MQYADSSQRGIYENEAKAINEIQKGILAISQKEEPFDVFICYKETDNNGRRTPDSVLANDLYHQLTQEGFKVFFSRITLEDKLGSAYEPYIFAALNSAKVMVVLGTKPEYFNAVWVKNEWSRYLALIKNGQKKMLIPAYKDMNPYDLPEEFSHLQAQDMSKLGFMQDLIRGIKKIAQDDAPKATVVKETVIASGNTNIVPLLKRVFMFLEDGDWVSANEYCEKVLDIDPENAEAYLGKLMAELRVRKQESLKDYAKPFDSSNSFQKAVRFGDDEQKAFLYGCIEHINKRNEIARLDGIYNQAKNAMSKATTEKAYKDAARIFETISEHRDSATLAQACYEKAESARKDKILADGKRLAEREGVSPLEAAIRQFESISGWKDADEQKIACRRKIEEIKQYVELARKEQERIDKRNRKIKIIVVSVIVAAVALIILISRVVNNVIIPNGKYNDAVRLMNAGKYTEAIDAFEAMNGYKDSTDKIDECYFGIYGGKYNDAIALMDAGKYTEAIAAFSTLDGYKESTAKINECNTAIMDAEYNDAIALMDAGNIIEAYEKMIALDGYKDSAKKVDQIYVQYKTEKIKAAKVGGNVFFGAYEQDNDTSNGREDIEWLVLDMQDGKALLISKYALSCKPYNKGGKDATWENSSLREWLNNNFVNAAFTDAEKAVISTVTVSADENLAYDTSVGNATQDRVFLLSITEANKYFDSDNARMCEATNFAIRSGLTGAFNNGNCVWWLRSPGRTPNRAAEVDVNGNVNEPGYYIEEGRIGVRPALWIDLNS